MKLGKEEIQKIVLGVLLLLVLLYGYFAVLLRPLKKMQANTNKQIAAAEKQLTEARGLTRRAQSLEESVAPAERITRQVKAMIPDAAPVAWFPPQVAEHFKRQGVDKAATRMTSESAEKELAGFRRIAWSVDLAKVEFLPFAQALAEFENTEPLAEISNLQIEAGSENVELQRAFLNVRTLVTP